MEYKTLGERIKHHRKRLGLTQEQLAERMRVSAQAVSKWENNLSCPDISVLPELADAFGITLDELMGRNVGDIRSAEPVAEDEKNSNGLHWSWSWDSPKKSLHGAIFALFVLLYGALLLTNNVLSLDVSWWTLLWTLGLCFVGVSGLCHSFSFFCLIMTLGGGFFLLDAYGIFSYDLGWGTLIPALLILWGISLLVDVFFSKKKGRKKVHVNHDGKSRNEYSCTDGVFLCEMSFGDHRNAVVTPLLRSGRIESNFGNFTVDFSGCALIAENCNIQVENNFGNLSLLIPDDYLVSLQKNETFLGDIKFIGSPAAVTRATLSLSGESNFGTVEVKYI